MSANHVSRQPKHITPNSEAYLLLGNLIERVGMRKSEFLTCMAELEHSISDDTFTNWGRPGRAFPRDWGLLIAMVSILSDQRHAQRCTAYEALHFFSLVGLPFLELSTLAHLFPVEEFEHAILPYLPAKLVERISGTRQAGISVNTTGSNAKQRGSVETCL